MALIERVAVKHRRSNSRTSSQSSTEAELNACEVSNRRVPANQSPITLSNIISTSYKHLPNLLIPDPEFLKLLKTVGAESSRAVKDLEVYTIQQLCFYLKEYIKSRQLYDANNVRAISCANDPLGKVFHVNHFAIHDVLDLISKTCTPVVEPPKSKSSGLSKIDGNLKSFECGEDVPLGGIAKDHAVLSPKKAASSVNLVHLGSKSLVADNETLCSVVTSSTDLVRKLGLKRLFGEEDREQVPDKRICLAKCSPEKDTGVVLEAVESKTSRLFDEDLSDVESTYSIQSKETAFVKDSSDDLWFLKEDDTDTQDLSDIYADEYDIVSELSHESSNEVDDDESDIFAEVQDLVVSFDGSETDFADGEQSDAEDESLSRLYRRSDQMWQCLKCHHSNPNPARLCNECLNVRTAELLQAHRLSSVAGEHHPLVNVLLSAESSASCSDGIGSSSSPNFNRQLTDSEHFQQCRTGFLPPDSHDESFAAGSVAILSSQESGFFSGDAENVADVTEAERANAQLGQEGAASDCGGNILNQSVVSGNACIICLSEPKVASLIHGKSGHQACCYQCALQLKKLRKPCPVCRRPIDKVIRNFVV